MSTKQQTPNQASQKKPKEAPQHAKNMHELTQPKAKIIQITKEDQKKIANVKRILQELNFEGAMWPDEDIYTVLKERVNNYSEAEIYQAAALHIMEGMKRSIRLTKVFFNNSKNILKRLDVFVKYLLILFYSP